MPESDSDNAVDPDDSDNPVACCCVGCGKAIDIGKILCQECEPELWAYKRFSTRLLKDGSARYLYCDKMIWIHDLLNEPLEEREVTMRIVQHSKAMKQIVRRNNEKRERFSNKEYRAVVDAVYADLLSGNID